VRENGGQYTHRALWVVKVLAESGRAEPYVVAADVYGAAPHVGRGGWTWYMGAAGWFYRVAVESILGVTVAGGRIAGDRATHPGELARVYHVLPAPGPDAL
jgi:cyclic beta-1,2-glucan synthetase